jgi:hypothetical protein
VEVGPLVELLDRIHWDADGKVEYHYVLADYLCSVVGGALQPQSDVSDARWALSSELPAFALSALTLGVIEKGIRLSSG